jgi:hypothetical protein
MKYDEKYIIEQYTSGVPAKTIATELGTYNTTIRRILIRNNINLRGVSETLRKVKNNPLSIDDHYWLGWLATDGCVTNGYVVLELQKRDEYIVKAFADYVGCPTYEATYRDKFKSVRAQFKNPECVDFLRSVGITERKSKTLEIGFDFT